MKLNTQPRVALQDVAMQRELREHALQVNLLAEGRLAATNNASTAAPTTGAHAQGDFVRNSAPSGQDAVYGWLCIAGGTPGTWVALRASDIGWRDILGQIVTRGLGATDPDWAQIGTGALYAYKFSINDVCWLPFHIPHDYVKGTDVHFHVHWLPSGTNTASVKWMFEYMYANGHNQAAFNPAASIVYAEQSPPGTAFQHMVTESAEVTISGMEPDGILYMKLARVTNGGTNNTNDIFVLTADVHYQSNNHATLNKSPDFYA